MAVYGLNGWPGLLLGVPWIVTGKLLRSAPVVTLIACRYQCGWLWSTPSSTFAVKYAVFGRRVVDRRCR